MTASLSRRMMCVYEVLRGGGQDRRIRRVSHDTLDAMKALFSVFLALGLCVGSVHAGPVRTARHVAKNSAIAANNVAHSVVKGTRRAVHTVVYNLTP